ncbi:MAG: phytanoyl-CoA dioxygenase family protein [Rhodospirillales bacterium]
MLNAGQKSSFERDGVIKVEGAFAGEWLDLAIEGIEQNRATPGPFFRDQTRPGDPARYVFDYWSWTGIPALTRFVHQSPAKTLAGELLGADKVTLLMDNWFMNEAGATNAAPWHQDEPYFDYSGKMLNVLISLDPGTEDEALRFAVGSHRWGKVFKATDFKLKTPFDGQADSGLADIPDVDAEAELVSFSTQPGDCLIFDLRMLHRGPNHGRPASSLRRRLSLRFGLPDTVFEPRGAWTREISAHLMSLGQEPGVPVDTPLTPILNVR